VLRQPGGSVKEIAEQSRIPDDQASLCLRALQARGLLHATRQSRWVHYFPSPDPLVPVAAPILTIVSRAILKENWSTAKLIRTLTAFTHPRRLTVLHYLLLRGPLSFSVLAQGTGISKQALERHLKKLASREMIICSGSEWTLHPDRDFFMETFLTLIAQHSKQGASSP